MSEQNKRGEELFEVLSQQKKQRRRRLIRNVLIIIGVIAVILVVAVMMLRRNVERRFAAEAADVLSHQVTTGTIHTTVTGSGVLTEEDLEAITVPDGVEINEVEAEAGDAVSKGDLLATVDMATVMTALSDLQEQMEELDEQINKTKGETASSTITAGLTGRVKIIYAEPGMDVSACMAEHGALAVLSLDGNMALELETDKLSKGDSVQVTREDGTTVLTGKVDAAAGGKATVLVTDNGPKYGETVTVALEDGTKIGSGKLEIHNPLAVTGYAGTINTVSARENAQVSAWSGLFSLKDTSFSANYDTMLRERADLEETLLQLLTIYRDGALLAPMDGIVSSVEYSEDDSSTASAAASTASASTSAYAAYAAAGMTTTTSAAATEVDGTAVLTLYPDKVMSVAISVDETDILALEEGQQAQVTVSSVSEEQFDGQVTDISKVGDTSTGVTLYSAEVTLDKAPGMLAGMTADVDIRIEGVEDALIIPLDALHQTSTISYVYTAFDEETQQYGGMVEVTTGMQNENFVEILSGLKQGDTVYYTEKQSGFNFFSMMGMGGMGNMGSARPGAMGGGQMPSRGR